ncbi:MAG TPA: MFS transporter [Blastocatellia bacterium]|nr:MFS transporter [Blastocatellia bacterium]
MSLPSSTQAQASETATPARASYAYYALAVLTILNLLNYIDRYIFGALIPYIKPDTGYSDQQLGLVGSAFTIVYTVCSPLFGYLGDRYRRGRLIAVGVAIWSMATAAGGAAASFGQLLAARSVVGVGEADYATIAPGLLSDFFVKARRGLVMSVFFATMPIGAAMGNLMGGHFGSPERLGWRHTLYLVGLPGLLTALAAYAIREPKRGAMDETGPSGDGQAIGFVAGYRTLLTNRGYLFASFGYAALTFALGALVFWAPEWLKSDKGLSAEEANIVLGLCAAAGGFIGTMSGGVIADRLTKRVRGAFFWVCAASSALAAIPTTIAIVSSSKLVYIVCIFLGVTLAFISNGPVNAVLVNLVPANLRATALGLVVVIIHVFGDAISLTLVGSISTWLTRARESLPAIAITLGHIFNIDPQTQTLSMALLLMPLAMLVSGALYANGLVTPEGKRT